MTEENSPKWAKLRSIAQLILTLVIILIAVRMAIGLVILILTVAGFTVDWLEAGAPLGALRLRPRDFIIPVLVLTIYGLSRLNKQKE